MRIGIYDPYLDTLGGGERYIFSIARSLVKNNEIDIFWNENLKQEAEKKFGFSLSGINFEKNIFSKEFGFIDRILKTLRYDIIFFVSDGSIPVLLSKKNFLVVQYPLKSFNKGLINRIKFLKISGTICYSNFIKRYLDKMLPGEVFVLNPTTSSIKVKKGKENIILNVGRFTKGTNNKKQDFLIEFFKRLYNQGAKDWKLILCGSVLDADIEFVKNLRSKKGKYPIEIIISPTFDDLANFYSRAKIYWHATGLGEDIGLYPEKAEHFGISTVEAMSAGCVPVVINAGGQKEIVEDGKNGFLWDNPDELIKLTMKIINDKDLFEKISRNAINRAKFFTEDRFDRQLQENIK
ncbi:MAG: glycosyltransferase family 4 protein [Candidatus Levybacteria bacterium]|nr:glycosyltransferase family 4 protein [Candidatus Levybacteria bacterium]